MNGYVNEKFPTGAGGQILSDISKLLIFNDINIMTSRKIPASQQFGKFVKF